VADVVDTAPAEHRGQILAALMVATGLAAVREAGATGLEPATSGVTGRRSHRRHNRWPAAIRATPARHMRASNHLTQAVSSGFERNPCSGLHVAGLWRGTAA
jgi:hypothetical protein